MLDDRRSESFLATCMRPAQYKSLLCLLHLSMTAHECSSTRLQSIHYLQSLQYLRIVMCFPVEIGIGLSAIGIIFTFLGLLFFFDRGLLAIGNVSPSPSTSTLFLRGFRRCFELQDPSEADFQIVILRRYSLQLMFLSGVALTIGPRATLRFFMRKKNWKVNSLPSFKSVQPHCETCQWILRSYRQMDCYRWLSVML